MNVVIRPALPDDAAAIAEIATASFGHAFDRQHIHQVLQAKSNYTIVADSAGTICGFADCFLTHSPEGVSRLEFDLLAVAESVRGAGIGSSLVRACTLLAEALDVGLARALVKIDNASMQSLLMRCGYQPMRTRACLFVRSNHRAACVASDSHAGHLICVNTLGYRGIWIEGRLSAEAVGAAMGRARGLAAHTVGAVIDERDSSAQCLLTDCGFSSLGAYQWWTFNPGSDRF